MAEWVSVNSDAIAPKVPPRVDVASNAEVPGTFAPSQVVTTHSEGEGGKRELLAEMQRKDLAPGARKILEQEYRSSFGEEPPAVPANRGSRIATELKGEWKSVNDVVSSPQPAGDGWVSVNQETKQPAASTGTKATDYAKSLTAGAMSGAGAIAQGGGELLARGINYVGGKLGFDPQARAVNPLQGWINDILDTRTPAAKKAEADSQISGELLKPSTWSFGNDPSVAGITLQGMNAIGQFAPNLGVALVTAGASIPVQLGVGAVVGGVQALGGSLDQERQAIASMSHEDLLKGSTLYAELIKRGVPQDQAKAAVGEAAAIGGGIGNAIPSAGEGAFENFLVGALTRGRLKIPSLGGGVVGRVVTGGAAGAALGGTEEAVEQAGQNVGSNVAIGGERPVGQDTMQQFVMGMIGQGAPGMAFGAIPAGKAQPISAPAPEAAAAPQETPVSTPSPAAEPQGPSFAEQFMAKPPRELTTLEQARVDGQELKETGSLPVDVLKDTARFENASLIAAYGENTAVAKVIEHPELVGGLKQAMLQAAPTVERVRSKLAANEQSRDITSDIVDAVDELAAIRTSGRTLAEAMQGMSASYEARQLVQFLHDNVNDPQKISQFIENYMGVVESMGGVPSQVRGRAFDIIQERNVARQHAQAEEGRQLLEKMEKQKGEEEAYAQRQATAKKRDTEIAKLKTEDQKRTQKAVATERAEKIAAELRKKAVAKKPEEKTAMSLAMEKANLKGRASEKPSAAVAERAEQIGPAANEVVAAETAKPSVSGAPQAGHAGEPQSVREGGTQEGAAAVHAPENVGSAAETAAQPLSVGSGAKSEAALAKDLSDGRLAKAETPANVGESKSGPVEGVGAVGVPSEAAAGGDNLKTPTVRNAEAAKLATDLPVARPDDIRDLAKRVAALEKLNGAVQVPSNAAEVPASGGAQPGADVANAARAESTPNRLVTQAEALGNLREAKTILGEVGGKRNIPLDLRVLSRVLTGIKNHQVFRMVVPSIPVDVMNDLAGEKFSPDSLLRNPAVFIDALTSAPDLQVQRRAVQAIVDAPALSIAEVASEAGARPAGDLAAARVANEGDGHEDIKKESGVRSLSQDEKGRSTGPFDPEKKYHRQVDEVKYIKVAGLKKKDAGEVSRVSADVAANMDFSDPIEVSIFADGDERISDGHHRVAAALQRGIEYLPVKLQAINAKGAMLNRLVSESNEFEQKLPEKQEALFSRPKVTGTEAFKRWFGNSKVVDAEGNPLVVYHGAKRLDRMGPLIHKNRATSGPMPFFTDDKQIASNYATNKSDTSLPEEDRDYNAWFRLKVPGARNAVNLDRAWWHLSQQQRDKIAALAPRVGNTDDGESHVLHPEGWASGLGGYDQHIKEARGNHLRALVEEWLNSGALYDREEEFQEVLKLAGVDPHLIEMHSPWAEYPGVLPVYLSIQNPLRTSDISQSVVDALQKRANRQGAAERYGSDMWAKETRDAREWMTSLREDIKDQKNSHAWTSIPDWVTDTLKKLGYDGIIDTGGKLGGQEHGVYIPFDPKQIKSAIGNRGTFDATKKNILFARGKEQSALSNTDITRAVAPILEKWKNAPEVVTIQSMADAPQAVQLTYARQQEGGAIGEPEAFIYRNKVYLVADGLASPERAVSALLHESVGHYGLRNVYGSRLDPILDEVAKSMPLRMKAKARQYGFNLGDVSERRQAAEEVLAEIAQSMPHIGVVKRLIAAVRQFLRDIGVNLKLSDNDVVANFILPAREYVERGQFAKLVEAPAFSRAAEAIETARQADYKAMASKFVDRLDQALNPLGTLPEQEKYLIRRYEAQGSIEKADEAAKSIREALPAATAEDQQAIFDYLTTAGAESTTITDPATRHKAEQIKADINRVGDELVSHGLLSEESRAQYRDAYLPRLYLKHLLSEQDWRALGAGKKPSDMGYLKARKDIPEDVRKVILGEIRDPGFLAAVAIAKPMRDMALLDWLGSMSQNDKWVLPGTVVDFKSTITGKTQSATPFYLKNEATRLRKQARYYAPEEAAKAEREAKAMDQAADDALDGIEGTHENYKQIPNTARYGRLRGLFVRSEIYDDLMGVQDFLPTDPGWFQNVFGYGGVGTKATQIWKAMKVSMNPPAQIRNFVSNGVLIQLSGVPLRLVPARVMQATRDVLDNGKYSQIAKKYGVGVSTFATQEVFRMKTELLDLEMKTRGMGPLGRLHRLAGLVMNRASDFYQMSETIFKTAKIIDAMEREGMSEQKAVLEANKWLFDYSLVQKSLRYARSAPIGVPFATFAIKVAPRLVEVAMHHPQRFLPWVGLFYGFPMMVASMLGVDKDDLDKLKKAMPQWLQDKGHALILPYKDEQGRWQVVDLGYFMPWTNWTELAGNVASGELGKAIQGAGIFGGPLTDIITAVKTGKDPFTGRDILAKGDPPERQAISLINYVWDMAMPPIVTDRGLVSPMGLLDKAYGGKLGQALTGTTNKFGEPRATPTQALLYALGVNVNALTPEYTRATNLQAMQRDMQDVKRQMVQKLYDRSLTDDERRDIAKEYAAEIIRRTDKMKQYMRESEIAPALATH